MCGIAGLLPPADIDRTDSRAIARMMCRALSHRGPDDEGVWSNDSGTAVLAHRRLSILDLSTAGHQPMQSACGRYVIAFNGEIYNWRELRVSLDNEGLGPAWKGHSDTEVLLASIAAWGFVDTLKKARGMFALALWDREENCLLLARDRVGEKPLYYGRQNGWFLFGSELKALRAAPCWQSQIDAESLGLFLRYGHVPAPYSIYSGVRKLPPGTWLRIAEDGSFGIPQAWWRLPEADSQREQGQPWSDASAVAALDVTLRAAVAEQMVADVPLGALLSGGVDSSMIAALMQAQSSRPVRTFTIGFNERQYDEAQYAMSVARHLGTEHVELYVSPEEAREIIPRLPDIYDEPFGDSSQIPTALVCALTRQHVTVCLSGDAGDELFGGYNRYFWANSIWRKLSTAPTSIRNIFSTGVAAISAERWNTVFGIFGPMLPMRFQVSNPGDKLHKLAQLLGARSRQELYSLLVSQWRGPLPLFVPTKDDTLVGMPGMWPEAASYEEQMMRLDMLTYLPDDILVKVDRAAMAVSLETRVPFLDARVIDFACRLPLHYKIRDGEGKWLLRQLLYTYVPKKLIDRPKQGFAVPIEHWLRGPLRDWAEDLLSPRALAEDGLLNPTPIRKMWKRHLEGRNLQHPLWNVLMYQSFRKRWT